VELRTELDRNEERYGMEAGVPSVVEAACPGDADRYFELSRSKVAAYRRDLSSMRYALLSIFARCRIRRAFPRAHAIANRTRRQLETLPDRRDINDMPVSYFSYASERARTLREPAGKVPG